MLLPPLKFIEHAVNDINRKSCPTGEKLWRRPCGRGPPSCLSACPPARLSVSLSARLSVCPVLPCPTLPCLSVCLSACLPVCLSPHSSPALGRVSASVALSSYLGRRLSDGKPNTSPPPEDQARILAREHSRAEWRIKPHHFHSAFSFTGVFKRNLLAI